MQIVEELHFKKSALQYVERARSYAKEKDYVSASMEWEKAGEEGYHLAFLMIAIYYISDYFDVEGLPGKAKYKRAIQILNLLFNFKLREYDHDTIMAWIGNAYKKMGLIEEAYEYYVKAGLEGLYYLYLYYYDKKNFKAADKMYADYKMVSHADPGGIYFDL